MITCAWTKRTKRDIDGARMFEAQGIMMAGERRVVMNVAKERLAVTGAIGLGILQRYEKRL